MIQSQPWIMAIEGPSGVGKSTAARMLENILTREGRVNVALIPCHVEFAGGDDKVPGLALNAQQQREFSAWFVELEEKRIMTALDRGAEIVLLDRSVVSLLAHVHVQAVLQGFDVSDWLVNRIAGSPLGSRLWPDAVVCLDVSDEVLKDRRMGRRAGWWNRTDYDDAFREYFVHRAHSQCQSSIQFVDAFGTPEDVVSEILYQCASSYGEQLETSSI